MHGTFDIVETFDIEEGFLLSGKGSIRQIFSGRRRAHRNLEVGVLRKQLIVSGTQMFFEDGRQRRINDPLTDLTADTGKLVHVINIKALQCCVDALVKSLMGQKLTISVSRGRKATGDCYPGTREIGNHLTQRGVFAPHTLHIVHAELVKPQDVIFHATPLDLLCPGLSKPQLQTCLQKPGCKAVVSQPGFQTMQLCCTP